MTSIYNRNNNLRQVHHTGPSAPISNIVLMSLAAFLLTGSAVQAQTRPTASRIRGFNNEVLRLHGELQQAGTDSTVAELRGQGAAAIRQRASELSALIQNDPA